MFLTFFKSAMVVLMIASLMVSAKLATLGLLCIKVFLNKRYAIFIFVDDGTTKILSRYSNYIVDEVM